MLVSLGFLATTSTAAPAPTELSIDPGTVSVRDGRLVFQFEARTGNTTDFTIWTSPILGDAAAWEISATGTVEAVEERRFRGSLPVTRDANRFVRVRGSGIPPLGPAPVFNEIMSDNMSALPMSDGSYADWLEFFNPHDESTSLRGYTLASEPRSGESFTFPDIMLQPGAFLLVFATGSPVGTDSSSTDLRVPFAIRHGGETLVLADPFGREVDRVIVPPLGVDEAVGRSPDGAARWQVFTKSQATPGRENPVTGGETSVIAPELSAESGYVDLPRSIRISTREPAGRLRYTTDGSVPTLDSRDGSVPVGIDRTTVVRAVTFDEAGRRSEESSRTYIVGGRHPLPVVSLAAPAANFDFRNGYLFGMGSRVLNSRGEVLENYPFSGSNAWQDREVEARLEWIEPDGRVGLRQLAGIKVYGGWGSRGYPQKSLALFARRKYGNGRFQHAVFPGSEVDVFESLVLRNSGNDNQSTHQIPPRPPIGEFGPTKNYGSYFVDGTFTLLRDAMMQRLLAEHTDLDTQAYRPAVLYLNGEYWGLYNAREKFNEHHLMAHHELPAGSIDLIEGYGEVRAGDSRVYRALRDFVGLRNMATGTNYQFVADTYLDIDNFIDYNFAVIYFQNFDIGNIKCWRPRTSRGRFRWMVYDQDYGFGLWPEAVYPAAMARDYADYRNMFRFATAGTGTSTGWPNAGGRTLLLRRLLAHPGFKERFIRRGTDLLNTAFREERVESIVSEMASVVRPEIAAHLKRWSWEELVKRGYGAPYQPEFRPFTRETWENHLRVLVDFARQRPARVRADCAQHFGLSGGSGQIVVRTEPAGAGDVRLNSLLLTSSPWTGTYFSDLTNLVRAVPRPGFRFLEWQLPSGPSAEPSVPWSVLSGETNVLIARFQPASPSPAPSPAPSPRLWISEIQYNSPEDLDSGDWIELHNPGTVAVDLDGWVLRDDEGEAGCVLPAVTIEPGGYRVVARSEVRFQWVYPEATEPIAVFGFGLGNGGDEVRLFDPEGRLERAVRFGDRDPWPVAADGRGSTLQLAFPDRDHATSSAWAASTKRGGTPGAR